MSDDRWIEVEDDFANSAGHFERAVQLFHRGGFDVDNLDGYAAGMAFMHSMQAGHTSLENGLKRILTILGEDLPSGDAWHSDLIKRVARTTGKRPAILGKVTSQFADETRRFRNVAIRSYDNFKPQNAAPSVVAAEALSQRILPELRRFQQVMDPEPPEPPAHLGG